MSSMRLRACGVSRWSSRNGPPPGAFTKWLGAAADAVANSLFGKKDSLFSAEQGIGRKLLNRLGDQLPRWAKEAGSVQHSQEIPC